MQQQYQAKELDTLLGNLSSSKLSGILRINAQTELEASPRLRVLVWRDGKIIYGGVEIPDAQAFARTLAQKYKPNLADTALRFASRNIADRNSVQELLIQLIKINAFEWQQVKEYACKNIVWTLEQVSDFAGYAILETELGNFDLNYEENSNDFDLTQLLGMVNERKPKWNALTPDIPSMESVPFVPLNLPNITDVAVKKHLEKWINGKNSLIDIATLIDRDPLQLVQIYHSWVQKNWITFVDPASVKTKLLETKQLPVILSVDDSPIIQTMIKRALSSEYEVLLANKALDALNLLTKKGDRISLLILDLTMPDIDGLQLCRTIRSIPKFKNLPVIMLTARDGFFDKVKGQMAGSDRYLTKPFGAEELLKIIKEYV